MSQCRHLAPSQPTAAAGVATVGVPPCPWCEIERLRDELQSERLQRQALERDAARYRCLRQDGEAHYDDGKPAVVLLTGPTEWGKFHDECPEGEALDAAIDAARAPA